MLWYAEDGCDIAPDWVSGIDSAVDKIDMYIKSRTP